MGGGGGPGVDRRDRFVALAFAVVRAAVAAVMSAALACSSAASSSVAVRAAIASEPTASSIAKSPPAWIVAHARALSPSLHSMRSPGCAARTRAPQSIVPATPRSPATAVRYCSSGATETASPSSCQSRPRTVIGSSPLPASVALHASPAHVTRATCTPSWAASPRWIERSSPPAPCAGAGSPPPPPQAATIRRSPGPRTPLLHHIRFDTARANQASSWACSASR